MARSNKLQHFRQKFNRQPENTKSVIVFTAFLGCFLLAGVLTDFSWKGISGGCLAAYLCIRLLRPTDDKH